MNRKSKVFILSFVASLVLSTGMPSYVEAAAPVPPAVTTSSNTGDHVLADNIRWVYQTINGVTYRRKYNFTKGEWVGDWERWP